MIPRIAVLGVGCKRGTTAEKLETAFAAFCAEHHFAPQGIVRAASIDLKQDEPGLEAFCRAHGWEMDFYTAAALRTAKGRFTSSGFVQSITGVDNVCERAGGAGCRRGAVHPEVGAGRRDPCRGAGPPLPRIGDGKMMNRSLVYVVGLGPGVRSI